MKLIRRCLFLVFVLSFPACTSVTQMPSTHQPSEAQEVKSVEREIPKKEIIKLWEISAKLPDPIKDEPSESNIKDLLLINYIAKRFKISKDTSKKLVELSAKYARKTFPSQLDILSIIIVESRGNVNASSNGNIGAMQIQRKSHVSKAKGRSLFNPDVNIEIGSGILEEYYILLKGNIEGTVLSYNAGIGNYLKHNTRYKSNYGYYRKYLAQKRELSKIA